MNKPEPMPHVYDWIKFKAWLEAVAPSVAREMMKLRAGWECQNGGMEYVALEDDARGWCGNDLSAESIAWLRENVAPGFWLRVWW